MGNRYPVDEFSVDEFSQSASSERRVPFEPLKVPRTVDYRRRKGRALWFHCSLFRQVFVTDKCQPSAVR